MLENVSMNVGDLAKPVTKLLSSIQAGIGTIYEPTRIRREATAQGDAMVIMAEAEAKKNDIARTAAHRLIQKEMRRQKNIDDVVEKTMKALPEKVSDEPVDPDWTAAFFNVAQDISDEQMQDLLVKVLAGEVAEPGSFGRRTLSIVQRMSASDLRLFQGFSGYVWTFGDSMYLPLGLDEDEAIGTTWFPFAGVLHLAGCELVDRHPVSLRFARAKRLVVQFGEVRYSVQDNEQPGPPRTLPALAVTASGTEVMRALGARADETFRLTGEGRHSIWDIKLQREGGDK